MTRDPVFMKLTFFCLLTGKLPTPEIDLGFAIAAGSLYADETFQLMKDTIEEVIMEYGIDKIRYGLIVFGDTATVKIEFSNNTNVDELINYLNIVIKTKGGAALDEMLKEAEGLFSAAGIRPLAKKVLVVITDVASGKEPSQVRKAVEKLQDKTIKIVAVSIGREADPKELEIITSTDNVIEEKKSVEPSSLKDLIMDKVLKGRLFYITNKVQFSNSSNIDDFQCLTYTTVRHGCRRYS